MSWRLILTHRVDTNRGTDLICQMTTQKEQTQFNVTWYTVNAAGIGQPFHSDIVQADLNGTVISRLKSKCDRPSEPYRCYSGKTSFKVKSTDITQFVKKRFKVIRGHLYKIPKV